MSRWNPDVDGSRRLAWQSVRVGDCLIWQGVKVRGYGRITICGVRMAAHRVAWENDHGIPVPAGMQIDHLCGNPSCVYPQHLEAVTAAENNRRSASPSALNGRKVVCINGHPFSTENTYWHGDERHCRTCRSEQDKGRRPTFYCETCQVTLQGNQRRRHELTERHRALIDNADTGTTQ